MALIRKENNEIKKNLIQRWVPAGASVLDVGCGQGGDIHKWTHVRIKKLVGIDPNPSAIEEARRRGKGKTWATFDVGTIESAPIELFDVICYNFSLQYQSLDLLTEVVRRLKPDGGCFIGTVTDSTRLGLAHMHGISVESVYPGHIQVYIPDTPYYANGPVVEPVLEKDVLIHEAEKLGLRLEIWEPFSIYAKFVFRY
jgi:SAM-dependent methyltransferase